MSKENLDKIIQLFKDKKINFVLDTHINLGKSFVRGIFINGTDAAEIKTILDTEVLKDIKIKKSYIWYLGEMRKAILLKFKEELVLEIPEVERYEVSSVA